MPETTSSCTSTSTKPGWPELAALAYLALLPLNIQLRGPLFAHDLLVPVLVAAVLRSGRLRDAFRLPGLLLTVFLGLAGLATLCHGLARRDLYELAIFAYMAVVFWFFRTVELDRKRLHWLGLTILTVFCAYAAGQAVLGVHDTYAAYEGTTLGFMAKRFFFTFAHPNLAGSYYVLPVLCIMLAYYAGSGLGICNWLPANCKCQGLTPEWGLRLLLVGVLCVPLLLTVSRHMLISLAVILPFALGPVVGVRRGTVFPASGTVLALVFGLFYLTLLVPFFPLQREFPFFNHATWGMYTIHQVVYGKMILLDLKSFFMGVGRAGVYDLYPQLVNVEGARAILAQYKSEFCMPAFTTYMDAHNEYLNLATAFGVPAMAACYAFWIAAAGAVPRRNRWHGLLCLFVAAVCLASLWDDLLSKRWIWASLGILVGQADRAAAATDKGEGHGS
ncbi:MAG: hypothetical protein A3K19_12900 [Lentisphaerae bacterium RIFOXYB12_FULL_65_16]|nr:MAG: hypothetical protein A3K18_04805 [Lentisphaerae bacterium RIFOXYA12_64_32]OGV87210.1 MAG: hypothetical protein A3K19_12900 [Lentisphaerae bacterium RIFOXYB12_FULL_65_16]